MTEIDTSQPTSDERMMAALAHFLGWIGSLFIWAIQKDKSRFVRFQATQALAFDLITILLMFVVFFCFFSMMFIGMFATVFATLNNAVAPDNVSWLMAFPALVPFGLFTLISPFSIALFVARLIATVSVLNGNHFRYPWLGAQVENFLAEKIRFERHWI